MWKILRQAKAFLRSEEAATATEYAVMIALVIIVVMAAVSAPIKMFNRPATAMIDPLV